MAIEGFPDPFIVCAMISDSLVFVALYHTYNDKHYHFIYDLVLRAVQGEVVELKFNSNKKNFPYKAFYNDDLNEIYLFYRQGQSFIMKPETPQDYLLDKVTDLDLGQMYLVYNQALITRSSDLVLFFRIIKNDVTGRREWKHYNTIHARGFIYYIKGNVRI